MKTLKAIIFLGLSLLVSCSPDISKSIGNMVKLNNAFRTDLADQPKVSLSGRIINLESNKPVNNCVVYLENTTFKSSVNDKGEFRFNNIPLADYSLIIIPDEGTFFSKKIDLTEHPDSNYVIYIKLPEQKANNDIFSPQEKVTILEKELEAQKKKSEKREKDIISKLSDLLSDKGYETYTIFMKTIIGHPSDCKILNPQVLSFETHENSREQWITCKTSAPIILLNKWLGYIQIIDLKKASITKSSGYYTISYDADICYVDILNSQDYKPDSAYCLSNRLNSFKGSTQHFFMSLAAGKLDEEGFLVSEPKVQTGHSKQAGNTECFF